jgi:DNA (cytosine-5)-methyltransferase 1
VIFDGEIGALPTEAERKVRESIGEIDLLLGGPPCQGHSNLNNHTRRRDPANLLYLKMARAAEIVAPRIVLVENVATVELDQAGVVKTTSQRLVQLGYKVAGRIIDLSRIGVPQRRRRFLLLASKVVTVDPTAVLERVAMGLPNHPARTVRWAIQDLLHVQSNAVYDSASTPRKQNVARMAFLFENDMYDLPNGRRPECHRDGNHSYNSVYGRLRWDHPAQTITTGFGSMGQGRYVHPARRRTITAHEAARLQTFPDWFQFGDDRDRRVLAKAIGNAVPPLLMLAVGRAILAGLEKR